VIIVPWLHLFVTWLVVARTQNDAIKTQQAIREVTSTLSPQLQGLQDTYKAQVADILASNKTAQEKSEALAKLANQAQGAIRDALNNVASAIGSIVPGGVSGITSFSGGVPTGGPAGQGLLDTVLPALTTSLQDLRKEIGAANSNSAGYLAGIGEAAIALKAVAKTLLDRGQQSLEAIKADLTINNQQTITVTGAAEFSERVINELRKQGFVTEEQVENIDETLREIMRKMIEDGSARLSDFPSQFGGR